MAKQNQHTPNPNDKKLVSDDMLSRLTQKINGNNILNENSEGQEYIESEEIFILEQLYEEIQKLKSLIRTQNRSLKSAIREELSELLEGSTLITEGKGDEVHLILKGHHFKGNMKPVVKNKK
jgi:hypothetical protein